MSNHPLPFIRLELEGMKYAIKAALSEHLIKMDADIQSEIDRVCTPENIASIVFETAKIEIKAAIDAEIHSFYRYGDGRAVIQKAVRDQLGGRA